MKYLWCTTNQTLPVILADGRKIAKYFSSANVPWLETLECVHLEPSVAHFVLNGSADALRVFVVGCHLAALAEILSCQGGAPDNREILLRALALYEHPKRPVSSSFLDATVDGPTFSYRGIPHAASVGLLFESIRAYFELSMCAVSFTEDLITGAFSIRALDEATRQSLRFKQFCWVKENGSFELATDLIGDAVSCLRNLHGLSNCQFSISTAVQGRDDVGSLIGEALSSDGADEIPDISSPSDATSEKRLSGAEVRRMLWCCKVGKDETEASGRLLSEDELREIATEVIVHEAVFNALKMGVWVPADVFRRILVVTPLADELSGSGATSRAEFELLVSVFGRAYKVDVAISLLQACNLFAAAIIIDKSASSVCSLSAGAAQ